MSDQTTDYPTMGTSIADDVGNRSGTPGGSNEPRTQYRSAGHRVPPARVRVQRLIDASSGQRMYDAEAYALASTAERDAGHLEAHRRAMATVVNAWQRAGDGPAGHLGGRVYLGDPANILRAVLGVDR